MASAVKAAYATLFKMGDGGSPETFTTISELTDIQPADMTAEEADVTNYSSTAGWAETLPTLLKGGQIQLVMNFLPTDATQGNSTGLLVKMTGRTKTNFKITFTDGAATSWTFAAYVVGFKPMVGLNKQNQAQVKLSVTGQPTLA